MSRSSRYELRPILRYLPSPRLPGIFHERELSAAPASTKNQLTGITYDAPGNVINDGGTNAPTYDAENRIVTDAGVSYSYDADGNRMEKSSGTFYWYGSSGGVLAESDLSGNINEEYIFFNGQRIARVDRPSGTVHYYFSNNLGSHTMVTSATGACEQDIDYYPYGGVVKDHCPNVAQHYKFNGKERDAESGLDNFGARYDSSTMGRFMTPDWAVKPVTVPYASFGDPQSLNLYSFVGNNPVDRTDPDGHVGAGDFVCEIGHHCVDTTAGNSCDNTSDSCETGEGYHDLFLLIAQAAQIEAQNTVDQQQGQGATQGTSTTPAATAPTKQFISINSAGIAGEKIYNPASKSENLEFNGNIYKDSQGHCCFLQTPAKGTADSSSPPDVSTLPGGATRVATYHTHAAYDARYDNEHFSPADKTNAGRRGVPIFVGTPGGVIRKYDPATGRITTFHSTTD